MKNKIRCLSLFDGISGARQGLKNLNIDCDYYASEIDKFAIQVSKNNHPDIIQIGNVKGIQIEDDYIFYNQDNEPMQNGGSFKSDVDLLIGGSPCQSFSIAGNQKGFEDPRGQLFFEYIRILKEVKPKFFILENVFSMKKEARNEMTSYLFGIEPILINSSLLTAQQRKRIYWIGRLGLDGNYTKVEISQPENKGILLKDILESGLPYQEKAHALTASYDGAVFWNSIEKKQRSMIAEPVCVAIRGRYDENKNIQQQIEKNKIGKSNALTTAQKDNMILEPIRIGQYNKGGQGDRIYSIQGKSVCLSANGGGRGAKTGLYKVPNDIVNFNKNQQKKYDEMEVNCDKSNCLTEAIGRGGSSSEFISSCKKKTLAFNKLHKIDLPDGDYHIRKLTPNECARLQGYPDFYHNGISNSQAYKCYGNSFTVPIIEHLLKHIFN